MSRFLKFNLLYWVKMPNNLKLKMELKTMQEVIENAPYILPILIAVAVVIIIMIVIFAIHIKVPPNTAVIISGFKKEPRILIGRTGFKVPFLERVDRLPLKQMVMEVHTGRAVTTLDYMEIQVSAVMKIKISDDVESLRKAMKNFLNQYPEETMNELQVPIQAILREITGTKNLEELINDKEFFANQLHQRAATGLSELGIEVLSCVIKAIEDESGIIKALGMEKSTAIHQEAAVLKAEADCEIITKSAEAKKAANDAHVLVEAEIAEKKKELEMQQANLRKETELNNLDIELEIAEKTNQVKLRQAELKMMEDKKRAEAEIAFEEATLAKRRSFEMAQSKAQLEKEERELKVKEKAAQVAEQVLEAEVKKVAEAEKYKQQQIADSNLYIAQKTTEAQRLQVETTNYIAEQEIQTVKSQDTIKKQEADTELYLKKQEAEALKLKAEAEAFTIEQAANAAKMAGLFEAEVVEAKGVAEANSRALKSDAMKNYSQAAIVEMIVNVLPEIATNIAQPISEVENMAILTGDTNSISGISQDVLATMVKMQEMVQNATGVDLKNHSQTAPQITESKSK